ncbi:MAG TPA: hypothetical protein VFA38_06045 [Nitrospirales bacterium]|nr:hypothetical protein [Nitrospirales bacterium]
MAIWSLLGALLFTLLPVWPAAAEDKALEDRVNRLEEAIKQFKEHERREEKREGREGVIESGQPVAEPGIGVLPDVARERRSDTQPALSFGSTGSGRLVYAKPFVAAPKAIVGGYMDIMYQSRRQASIDNGFEGMTGRGINSTFDQQRFVPFIYADITEHIKFASELEIEHGIREVGGPDREVEFGLEFAHIDYLVKEAFNLRAGILLLPVGKFNLLHDSPLNDLPDRPLVSQFIIPTTLSETGAGFYGTLYPGRLSKIDYEFYVTTGPCGHGPDGTPGANELTGTRGTRQRKCATDDGLDINNGKAFVGRLAYSPMLGIEVALSGYRGSWDAFSKRPMTIGAVDWTLQRGPFEVIGEAAWVYIQDNSKALPGNTLDTSTTPPSQVAPGTLLTSATCPTCSGNSGAGIPPQRMFGYYIQGNYHFMPEFLSRWSPKRFGEGSTFTGVVRWDQVNTNQDNPGGLGDLQRLTLGLNYRPIEDTVFKFGYFFDMKATNHPAGDVRIHDNGVMLMAATYF